eukprot:31304-Pelagococcus_subviridis.AAC.17
MNKAPTPPASAPRTIGSAATAYTSSELAASPNARDTSNDACFTNIRFKSACIWQLCTTISVASTVVFGAGGSGTVTTSNSPRSCSCANSGRLRTYTLTPPAFSSLGLDALPPLDARRRRHRCTAAANGFAFIRRDSLLSNI